MFYRAARQINVGGENPFPFPSIYLRFVSNQLEQHNAVGGSSLEKKA